MRTLRTPICLAVVTLAAFFASPAASAAGSKPTADALCQAANAKIGTLSPPASLAAGIDTGGLPAPDLKSAVAFLKQSASVHTKLASNLRKLPASSTAKLSKGFGDAATQFGVAAKTLGLKKPDAARLQSAVTKAAASLLDAMDAAAASGASSCFSAAEATSSGVTTFNAGEHDTCVDDPNFFNDQPAQNQDVPCTAPHVWELFGTVEYNAAPDAPYPGDDTINSFSDDACGARFKTFVGTDYRFSVLDYDWAPPDADSWPNGDRAVWCRLYSKNEESLTGLAKGTSQ